MRVCVLKMHGGNLWRISNNWRMCVCVLVCGIYVCSSLHRGSGSKSNRCVCASVQTDLGTGDVSSFEMHGFSTPATGHVSFPDESEETPAPLFSSSPLKAGRWGFPSEQVGPAPLHLHMREGVSLLCVPFKLPPAEPLSRSSIFSPALSLQTSLTMLWRTVNCFSRGKRSLLECMCVNKYLWTVTSIQTRLAKGLHVVTCGIFIVLSYVVNERCGILKGTWVD